MFGHIFSVFPNFWQDLGVDGLGCGLSVDVEKLSWVAELGGMGCRVWLGAKFGVRGVQYRQIWLQFLRAGLV